MAFKMKGPTLYPNYRGSGKNGEAQLPPGIPKDADSYSKLHVNHEGPKGVADGRAASSPFQVNDKTKKAKIKKTKEDYLKEGFTPRDADKMMADGATTGVQDKNPVPPKKTTVKVKKGSAADKKSKKASQGDFEPAYPGADYSKTDIAKMTEKEKIAKIDGYTPKKKKTKK